MGIKMEETEAEFRKKCRLWGYGADSLISVLDLEFQEPEGREGVPERLEVGAHHHGDPDGWYGWALWSEEDARDLNQAIIKGHGPAAFVTGPLATAEAFRDAYNRGQDFPALLALARELESELRWLRYAHGDEAAYSRPENPEGADALLTRARDLLARLEGGRP